MKTLDEIIEMERAGASSEDVIASLDEYISVHTRDDEALTERGLV